MLNISVHEILLKHGKWVESKKFVLLVAKKRNVSERQAYNLIKEAYDKKEIKKFIFPDRTVIYGLVEFGPPLYTERERTPPVVDEKQVEKAMKELKSQLGRTPSVEEVARQMIMDPEDRKVREAIYRVMRKLGIREPSRDEISEAQLPFQRPESMRGEK